MPKQRIETPADGVALVVLSRPERLTALGDDLPGLKAEAAGPQVRSRAGALRGWRFPGRFGAWRQRASG